MYDITKLSNRSVFDNVMTFDYITTDTVATVKAAGYFDAQDKNLTTGNYIFVKASDASDIMKYNGTGVASTLATFA